MFVLSRLSLLAYRNCQFSFHSTPLSVGFVNVGYSFDCLSIGILFYRAVPVVKLIGGGR